MAEVIDLQTARRARPVVKKAAGADLELVPEPDSDQEPDGEGPDQADSDAVLPTSRDLY